MVDHDISLQGNYICKWLSTEMLFGIPTAHMSFLMVVDEVGDYVLSLLVIHQSA